MAVSGIHGLLWRTLLKSVSVIPYEMHLVTNQLVDI